jgi:hypothetical protein
MEKAGPMKMIRNLACAALVALAATLLLPTSITLAGDHGQPADDNDRADHDRQIDNPFAILLDGVYKGVAAGDGPEDNLGLTRVNLNDGSYSKVKIFAVHGLPGNKNKPIGTFYVQIGGSLVAYDLPGGAFAAQFTGSDVQRLPAAAPPGESWTLDGTFKLVILEATGSYRPFADGHIHMVDILKFRGGDGTFLENCFCHVHRKLVTP